MGMFFGWSKALWIRFGVVTVIFLAFPILAYWNGFSVNNALILATGLVLLLYTIETQGMRLEIVHQNEIAIQPLLIAGTERREGQTRVVLRNIGRGTALFVHPSDVVLPEEQGAWTVASFRTVDYISPEQDAVIMSDMTHYGPGGDVIEGPREGPWADAFALHLDPENSPRPYEITIQYEDITGQRRHSVMQMGKGGIRLLRHGKN